MDANLKAFFDGFIDLSLLKFHVVNDNVNNVYLMTSFSMSHALLLQFSSRQFFGLAVLLIKKVKRDYINEFTRM